MKKFCVLDYETRSRRDIKLAGSHEYAKDPSTKIMCVSWVVGTKEELSEWLHDYLTWRKNNPTRPKSENPFRPNNWSPAFDKYAPQSLIDPITDPDILLKAHNALFEQNITEYVLTKYIRNAIDRDMILNIPINRWRCSAAQAAAVALPRKLEQACKALNLPVAKDMEGHKLMLKMSKPRKPTKNNPSEWHNKKSQLIRLMEYCDDDVVAEVALFLAIPELPPQEQKIWELDQKINKRGFHIDTNMVKAALRMIDIETVNLHRETEKITGGKVRRATEVARVLEFVRERGVPLPNLQAKTLTDALAANIISCPKSKRLIEIRQAISKTSTGKYIAFMARVGADNFCRDNLMYHGASTGRWTGMGIQPHNFPQGRFINDQWTAAEMMAEGDLELIRILYGDPMNTFASCLRSVITAPKGKEVFAGDFNAIEARVLFWFAEHEEGLRMFRDGEDLYKDQATAIYVKKIQDILDEEREVGKRAILGCGFGMGWKTFHKTCKQYGQEVSPAVAKKAVDAYRSKHKPVKVLWSNIEKAAIAATRNPGKVFKVNKTKWGMHDKFLYCELPSGRRLWYYGPTIKWKPTPWGEKKPTLYHWGVHPKTKQWVLDGTYGGRLVENIVQGGARDFMANSMVNLEEKSYENFLTVHDEVLCYRHEGESTVEEYEKIMAMLPPWGKDCPVKVKAWKGPRYKK